MDYSKVSELLNQDTEKERDEKAENAVHDNLYNRGYRKGHLRGYKEGSNIVLSKIRAEIAELQLIGYATVNGKREIASKAVMQVIDKYKAESEE